jgi:hypothetical protein
MLGDEVVRAGGPAGEDDVAHGLPVLTRAQREVVPVDEERGVGKEKLRDQLLRGQSVKRQFGAGEMGDNGKYQPPRRRPATACNASARTSKHLWSLNHASLCMIRVTDRKHTSKRETKFTSSKRLKPITDPEQGRQQLLKSYSGTYKK